MSRDCFPTVSPAGRFLGVGTAFVQVRGGFDCFPGTVSPTVSLSTPPGGMRNPTFSQVRAHIDRFPDCFPDRFPAHRVTVSPAL